MNSFFVFMRENSEWLFGGSGLVAMLITVIKYHYSHNQKTTADTNGTNFSFLTVVHFLSDNHRTKINFAQYGFWAFAFFFAYLTLSSPTTTSSSECNGGAAQHTINSGNNSIAITASDCANVILD